MHSSPRFTYALGMTSQFSAPHASGISKVISALDTMETDVKTSERGHN